MSFLESNKHVKEKRKDAIVTGRIPADIHEKFLEICEASGFTVSEAVRALVINEVSPKRNTTPQSSRPRVEPPKQSAYTPPVPSRVESTPVSSQPETAVKPTPAPAMPEKKFNPVTNIPMGRFNTNRWKHNNMLPCPICVEWVSASNFSRHAKVTHDLTTKEIFTQYADKADGMIDAVKS